MFAIFNWKTVAISLVYMPVAHCGIVGMISSRMRHGKWNPLHQRDEALA